MDPMLAATVTADGDTGERAMPVRLGHFEIVGRLGAGGMGLVLEGRDTVLERRVALKLLHPARTGNSSALARLLREAQALAKLSHRNVVTVYEVGMAGDELFVAMELVEGETLATWMLKPRGWREVLDVFIAAGHGLAAVHALGLVHRDFKPSNVLMDKDGTPKLGDFGLVRPVGATTESSDEVDPNAKLTVTGSVMGTPAYMAPEQRLGQLVDARADQYSFAKSLTEALGQPVAKLQPILARALAEDRDDRYPDMQALLADLSRVRRGNRTRWIAVGSTTAVLGAVAIAWGFGRAQSGDDPCSRPTARVAKAWSSPRRSALQAHMLMIDPMLGAQRFAIASSVLDRGSERWLDQHVDACRSAQAGRQSGALLDRRMGCLDRALLEIEDTVSVLEKATDRTMLDNAMKATTALPTLDDCADVDALLELVPRPTNPVQRLEADALSRETVDIDVALRTGGTKTTHAAERANAAVVRARKLGDPETLARALRSLSGVQLENEAGEATVATLREAITAASTAHDDRMVADLWSKLLTTLLNLKKADEARTLLPAAEAAVARSKATIEVQVIFLKSKAEVASASGDLDGAHAAIDEALQKLDAAGAGLPFSSLRPLLIPIKGRAATLRAASGDFKGMADGLRETISLVNAVYGPDHPSTLQMHFNLGIALRRLGDDEAALVEFREAARIGEARLSPSPSLADYIYGVGSTLVAMERNDEAIPYLERATAMARATLPPGDPRLNASIGALAGAYLNKKQFEVAKRLYSEQISILEKNGVTGGESLADAYWNRGTIVVLTHQCANGWSDLDEALALYRELGKTDDVHATLVSIAECQLDTSQFAAAVRTTEQVLSDKDASPRNRAFASFNHGKAIAFAGHHAAGVAEVRKAREEMVREETAEDDLKVVDEWLAEFAK